MARKRVRSSCFAPGKVVRLSDLRTGSQQVGSPVSQTNQRAHVGKVEERITKSPGGAGRLPSRIASKAR